MYKMNRVNYVVLHHTGIDTGLLSENNHYGSLKNVIQHNYGNKFPLAYHYVIGYEGTIFSGQKEGIVCPHCGVDQGEGAINNWNALGVSCMGNFDNEKMKQVQFESLIILLERLQKKYPIPLAVNFSLEKHFIKHRTIANTNCPGRLFPYLDVLQRLNSSRKLNNSGNIENENNSQPKITPRNWFEDPVNFCLSNGIMTGDEDGFRPMEPVTRAELASVLYRLLRGDKK